ncbi:hypothetical protein VPNG_07896 [Cytospora leucostoma]|uniref:HSF-type DNA-binding domain-containing protein n=1 Tax=Cytospora leucostoma TaxID=1230097 RepID=A0A423WGS7_9PEZI|nr:hypothetical protein VPNG_07896 [Cytospora leucostoma]
MRWNGVAANGNNYADVSNPYLLAQQSAPLGQGIQSPTPSPSNVLALREPSASRALVPTAPRAAYDEQLDQWGAPTNDGALVPALNGTAPLLSEEEHLRIQIARARKIEEEATKENPGPNQKRSIPPFVLKLASFLNNGKNSDLIRWSEKGDSFIVLDEDEFAKKLIPEMFKHNNYASFVRQLNMYGFHKKVGLSDNSMRASEKKNKSPSEYWNPYFLRDHPVLQWLIQKPNKSSGKRKLKQATKDASGSLEPDSDVEDFIEDTAGQYAVTDIHPGRDLGRTEAGPLAKTEIGKFREQLAQVQQKQQQVLNMIQNLRRSQDEIVQRAQMFEQMHHRHENSITAILNFLANVFRKSLENDGGAQNLSEMLASILPQHGQNPTIPTAVVQNLGDLFQRQDAARESMSPAPPKRPQHLLPGIPGQQSSVAPSGNMATMPPSPAPYAAAASQEAPQTSRVTEVFDASPADTSSPNYIRNELQSNPQETMMRIMDNTNARMTSNINLAKVADATSATMPTGQRDRMVSSMSRRMATPSNESSASPFQPPVMPSTSSATPASSSQPAPAPAHPIASLSPILNAPKPPSVQEVSQPLIGIQELERAQRDVDKEIQNLGHTVASLSPNGHIPGYGGTSNDFDFNQYLDLDGNYNSNYGFDFNDLNHTGAGFGAADGNDFDFSLSNADFAQPTVADGTAAPLGDGLSPNNGAVATGDTPSPAVTEEILRTDLEGVEQPVAKRRRQE